MFLCTIWHCASFVLCVARKEDSFCPDSFLYRAHRWERNGKFYSDTLHINRWKDRLPQYNGKKGFSKSHLDSVSIEYLDRFIAETCRGEWNHGVNCLFSVVLMMINEPMTGGVMSVMVVAGNLPFVLIQRYNRFRLQKLRTILVKKSRKNTAEKACAETETVEDDLISAK